MMASAPYSRQCTNSKSGLDRLGRKFGFKEDPNRVIGRASKGKGASAYFVSLLFCFTYTSLGCRSSLVSRASVSGCRFVSNDCLSPSERHRMPVFALIVGPIQSTVSFVSQIPLGWLLFSRIHDRQTSSVPGSRERP